MKVIQINVVYPYGSTGKIVSDIHDELINNNIESLIICGRSKLADKKILYTVGTFYSKIQALFSRIHGIPYGGCFLSTKKIIKILNKEKPDIVHLHCLNGTFVNIYKLVDWLKQKNVKTVLTLHAEFMYTANCSYAFDCEGYINGCLKCKEYKYATKSWFFNRTAKSWKLMFNSFKDFKDLRVVSVSPWLMERAKKSLIFKNFEHFNIYNGLNSDIFCYSKEKSNNDFKIVFHATPEFNNDPNHVKGGYYILKIAEKLCGKNIKFYIAGNYDKSIKKTDNIVFLGKINDQKELAKYYQMADVTLIASRVETFSMVCAESLSCGTPVVGFKAGAPELISLKDYSFFAEHGNVDLICETLINVLSLEFDREKISKKAFEMYSKNVNTKKYIDLYNLMLYSKER